MLKGDCMNDILVVGGYGDVGKYVVEELLSITSKRIIVAGRSRDKAGKFIENFDNNRLDFMYLDIYNRSSYADKINGIKIVVMCLSPKNNDFAVYCLEKNINYIDISPSNQTAHELKKFHDNCINNQVLCLLGVGICPGLSTLLVKEISKDFDLVNEINLTLMLGIGDEYGKDAIQWLLTNFSEAFTKTQNGKTVLEEPFIGKAKVHFPQDLGGERSAYAFNLSDQEILRLAHDYQNVSTYFCYDLKSITWIVHVLAKIKLFKLLKFARAKKVITAILNLSLKLSKRISSDSFAINVEIGGYKNGIYLKKHSNIVGKNSPKITGKVIAQTVAHMLDNKNEFGVLYLSQLFDLNDYDTEICRL